MSKYRNTDRLERRPVVDPLKSSRVRLVALLGSFAVVILLMQQARRPETWEWMWRLDKSKPPPVADGFDNRLLESSAQNGLHVPGSFVSPADRTLPEESLAVLSHAIDPMRLAEVQDDTYFRAEESDAWFHLLAVLKQTPASVLQAASRGEVSVLQLYRQIKSYRGQLVTVGGIVRRAHELKAPANDVGITSYWQLWLFEKDGMTSPCVVYVLDVPSGFPQGMSVEEPAELTGYAYKRWAYNGAGGLMVAPVVLAKNVTWQGGPVGGGFGGRRSSQSWIWTVVLVALVTIVAVRWSLIWSGRKRIQALVRPKTPHDEPVEFDFLNEVDDDS